MTSRRRFSAASRALKLLGTVLAGLFLFKMVVEPLRSNAGAISSKLQGKSPNCPWWRILHFTSDNVEVADRFLETVEGCSVEESDPQAGIDRVRCGHRSFWLPGRGRDMSAVELLGFLLADHDVIRERYDSSHVQPGDIVVDVGAHVGTFTRLALDRGAAAVIAFEPDPLNLACFRKNFVEEIASGQVRLVPKGAWSEERLLTLWVGEGNSGESSVVLNRGGSAVEVPMTTLDIMIDTLRFDRVDFVKMDIEGAEREALRGAAELLRRHRPRLLLDSYHRPDDMVVLPAFLREIHSDYTPTCGRCEPMIGETDSFTPHIVFWR